MARNGRILRYDGVCTAGVVSRGAVHIRIRVPIVTGLVIEQKDAQGNPSRANSVVAGDTDGRMFGRYDKRALVPFGEQSAFGIGTSSRGFTQGKRTAQSLTVLGHSVAVFVCFEALDSELVRDAMHGGASELLLNPTSDAWFTGTHGPAMHLAFAKIRAIEHDRYLLRPTTTGLTTLIDPRGRRVWSFPEAQAASGIAEFSWLTSVTPFTRFGPKPLRVALLLIVIIAVYKRITKPVSDGANLRE
jgi:apolipoprotein N-acyltransferase